MRFSLRIVLLSASLVVIAAFLRVPLARTAPPVLDWQGRRQTLQQIQAHAQPSAALAGLATDLISAASSESSTAGITNWQTWCDRDNISGCGCVDPDPLVCRSAAGLSPTGSHKALDPRYLDGIPVSSMLLSVPASIPGTMRVRPGKKITPTLTLDLHETVHINPRLRSQIHSISAPIPPAWDNEAITAKARWAVFLLSADCLVLPVWSGATDPPNDAVDFASWTKKVAVVRTLSGKPRDCGDWHGLEEVSLSMFYHRPALSGNQMMLEPPQGQANADALLVGLHMASNEVTNWFWMTAWWSPGSTGTRPTGAPWSNYTINADISVPAPVATPVYPTLSGNPIFNPYIEGNLPVEACSKCGGVKTDCISCHSHAAFTASGGEASKPTDPGFGTPQFSLNFVWSAAHFSRKP